MGLIHWLNRIARIWNITVSSKYQDRIILYSIPSARSNDSYTTTIPIVGMQSTRISSSNVSNETLMKNEPVTMTTMNGNGAHNDQDMMIQYIPPQFQKSDISCYHTWTNQSPFPRWDDYSSSVLDILLDFVNVTSQTYEYLRDIDMTVHPLANIGSYMMNHTTDHMDDVIWWYPETLYVIEASTGLWYSNTTRQYNIQSELVRKQYPLERMIQRTWDYFVHTIKQALKQQRWPRLEELFRTNGSFPFMAWFGDYTGCNYHNWRTRNGQNVSLLLFTTAGNIHCNNTFPVPNYQTIRDSYPSTKFWFEQQASYREQYPTWLNKIPKVVWRGGLTGHLPRNESKRCIRYQITKLVHSNILNETQRAMFDVKLTSIPTYFHRGNIPINTINTTLLGGVSSSNYMEMDDYQMYRAILDLDGESWSSRFGKLLCYNSVVIKVEPQYVDYFLLPTTNVRFGTHTKLLKPWKHYIPVKHDLSDLLEKVEYVLSDTNGQHLQRIIDNANVWCQKRMTYNAIPYDFLDILEKYLSVLNISSNDTWYEQWKQIEDSIRNGPYKMTKMLN